MIWLAMVFVWFLITLWLRPARFAIGAFLAALGFLASLNMINPDATIAAQNLARYQATGQLDAGYLTQLSADAVPVLVPVLGQLPDDAQALLRADLRDRLARMDADPGWRDWPALHLARWDAYAVLNAHRAELGSDRARNKIGRKYPVFLFSCTWLYNGAISMLEQTVSRRKFLKVMAALAVQASLGGAGAAGYSRAIEPGWVEINPVRLTLPRLPSAFHGYRIAQISDIHMDGWMDQARLAAIVGLVNAQQPDLIAITGDFVTGRATRAAAGSGHHPAPAGGAGRRGRRAGQP